MENFRTPNMYMNNSYATPLMKLPQNSVYKERLEVYYLLAS